jgi:hypothetical protein
VKQKLGKLFERIRRKPPLRWPWSAPRPGDRPSWLPESRTGWTVHRDVALRLRNLGVGEREPAFDVAQFETDAFKIRIAGPPEARREAGTFVHQRYVGKGYLTSATLVNAHVCTFSAYDEGRLAGTLSLRLDSPGEGLAADALYRVEVALLRGEGRRICEFTRLAVETAQASPPVLAALFHTVFLFAQKVRGFDFALIEVNPRHVGFYRRALGFAVIGARRHNTTVNAPAVLMGVSFDAIADRLRRHAGKATRHSGARNLYQHGFSPEEEAGILLRLRALDAG